MTILVVLVLVILWAAVLTPMAIRRFRQEHSDGSIDTFHEQLHLLERAGPKLVPPAHRLEAEDTFRGSVLPSSAAHGSHGPDLVLVGAAGAQALGAEGRGRGGHDRADSGHRRRVRKHRRNLVAGLVATIVVTGGLGAMHGLHVLWVFTVLSVVALAGYVALAAYAQLLEAERRAYRPAVTTVEAGAAVYGHASPAHVAWREWRDGALEAAHLGPAVVALGARIPAAARAGYPGAWDEEPHAPYVPRHAAAGG